MKEKSTTVMVAISGLRAAILLLVLLAGCGNGEVDLGDLARAGGGPDRPQVLPYFEDDSDFEPFPESRPGDWRLGPGRMEDPQSFPRYVSGDPVRASGPWKRIILQPVGTFEATDAALLTALRQFTELFFVCSADLADPVPLPEARRRKRIWNRGPFQKEWVQHHTKTIMEEVLSPALSEDTICLLGILREDLYPDSEWNYVFGQAYLHRRVGVYSLARYFAHFWQMEVTPATRKRAFRRSLKVLAHETGHMFSMEHCHYYQCLMNGSNSLEESDRQPLWLCPVCASKLIWNRQADPAERDRGLARFYREHGFDREATWYLRRARRSSGKN